MTGDHGVYLRSTDTAHWAWVGLRLTPAAGHQFPEAESEIAAVDRAWLAGQWTTEHGARFEIRYTGNGPGRAVSCVLLGRVSGRDHAGVHAAALALRTRLAAVPPHVRAEPMAEAEVAAALAPARADHVELRKRLMWAWSSRRDTGRAVCLAVSPLVPSGLSWFKMQDELARLPAGTTVGLYLEPYRPSDGLAGRLRRLAGEYAALGTAGRPDPTWNVAQPADPFAAGAAPGYQEAVARYADRCYRLRITIIADTVVDPTFAELLAATTGGAVVRRPTTPELGAAWHNFATLDRAWLDETYRQGAPAGKLDDAERILCDLADPTEAAAVFRFPLPTASVSLEEGWEVEPEAAPAPASTTKRVFVSYVERDLAAVELIVTALRQAGYDVWIDRSRLLPGRRWKSEIKKAIADGDYFLACFSPNYWKPQTYMNEELIHAVERLRLMPRDRDWFIPVKLAKCDIPDFPIGPGETLADTLQYVDFSRDWDEAVRRVLAVLGSPTR